MHVQKTILLIKILSAFSKSFRPKELNIYAKSGDKNEKLIESSLRNRYCYY